MEGGKKGTKSKFVSKDMNISDLLNESQFEQAVPKKRATKRQKNINNDDEEDISKLIGMYQANAKKKRSETSFDAKESRQKLLEILDQQTEARKGININFMKSLLDVITQLEADYEALRENEQKLEQLAGVFVKCIKQTGSAQRQNLKALKDIHAMFKTEVEGLLTRGAMKPDDRPLWFDVYKKFPPITEPKFARPKPEAKPIRQILYPEDVVRAKFHSKGHGYGAINMLNPAGESHIKKLVQQYDKLKAEGVAESELIEKSVEVVGKERQERAQEKEYPKPVAKNPNSATSQILSDAKLDTIFKE